MTIIRRIKDRREMRSPGARFPEPEHQPEPEREYEYDPDWEREVASRYAADDAVQQDWEERYMGAPHDYESEPEIEM